MKNDHKEKQGNNQSLPVTEIPHQKTPESKKGISSLLSADAGLILAGIFQMIVGLSIVSVTILGLLTPLWLSATLSLIGSISSMFGVYLIFHAVASNGKFDSLINSSIKRVIRDQN